MSTENGPRSSRAMRLVLLVAILAMLILCCTWLARLIALATIHNPS